MTDRAAKRSLGRNAVRAVVFLCLVAVAVIVADHVLGFDDAERSQTVIDEFYELDGNTVDCIYLGASATQRGYVEPVAFHDHGVAAYSYTCGTQPFVLTKFLMEETLKTQDPKLFIIELRGVCKGADGFPNVAFRRMIDNMKPSLNKVRAIRYVLEYASHGDNVVDKTGLSYYFPIIQYHSRWNPSKKPHYLNMDYYKGYGIDPDWVFLVKEIHPLSYSEEKQPLAPETEKVLKDLLDYCDAIDAKVLFVVSPYEASEGGMKKLNTAVEMVRARNYECLDFLPEEEREALGLDDRTCYYNREHLNYNGATKYTHFLSEYIMKNYGVPDRRGDDRWESWAKDYDRFEKNLNTSYSDKYEKMITKINTVENEVQ